MTSMFTLPTESSEPAALEPHGACQCHQGAQETVTEDPAERAAALLESWEDRFGDQLGKVLYEAARGAGPLLGTVESVGSGTVADCDTVARAGDFLVAADLFADEAPRVEIVGMPQSLPFGETSAFVDDETVAILRPLDEENVALGPVIAAAAQGLSGLVTDPFAPATSAFNAGRAGLGMVRDAIDTGYRVVEMARDIREAYGPLRWHGPNRLRLEANYNPGNLGERTNVWSFTINGKIRPEDTVPARFPFQVIITSNCFSIISARIVPQSPDVPRTPFSENEEGVGDALAWVGNRVFDAATAPVRGAANMATRALGTHRMHVRATVDRTQYNNFPYQAAFDIHGTWNPADAGSLRDDFAGRILVKANGEVSVNLSSTRLVSVTRPRRVSGPGTGNCQQHYDRTRQLMLSQGQQAPGASPARSGGSGRSSYRGGSRRASQGLVPDPRYGKHIFFATARSGSSAEIQALLREWWAALPIHIQNALQAGQTAIYVDGHADPTGSESRNRALSDQRARTVAGIVRSLLPGARIIPAGHGSSVARQQGVTGNDPSWRRVTIRLDIRG